jgi:phosphodiesterase/alkaline phosphatase D-like protein
MTRLGLALVVGVVALGLAGCVGNTDPATNVTTVSAKLNAHGRTNNGPAVWWWEYATNASNLGTAADVEVCGYPPEPDKRCGPAASSNDVALSTTVTGLRPDTTYYFRACGQDQSQGSTPACGRTLSFKTLALADPVVAAAGDIACGADTIGSVCKQQATADVVSAMKPNAVLVLGDNQYESGSLTDFNS